MRHIIKILMKIVTIRIFIITAICAIVLHLLPSSIKNSKIFKTILEINKSLWQIFLTFLNIQGVIYLGLIYLYVSDIANADANVYTILVDMFNMMKSNIQRSLPWSKTIGLTDLDKFVITGRGPSDFLVDTPPAPQRAQIPLTYDTSPHPADYIHDYIYWAGLILIITSPGLPLGCR